MIWKRISKWFKKEAPDQVKRFIFSGVQPSYSGVVVDDDTAMTIPAIYACVNLISGAVATLPLHLYRRFSDGETKESERVENTLVSRRPSPLYTAFSWRRTALAHVLITGNSYTQIVRSEFGTPSELRLLSPHRTRPFLFKGELFYETYVSDDAATERKLVLKADDVIHFCGLSNDGIVGRSPIAVLRETAGLYLANVQYTASVHKNGGRLRGYLKHPNKLTPEQVAGIRENFVAAARDGYPILENGLTFEPVSLSPADLAFLETAKLTIEEIARLFAVPLHMIGVMTQATYSNMEQQSLDFLRNTLLPWIKMIEAELDRKLLPASSKSFFFRHNFDAFMRAAYEDRMKGYQIAVQNGILSPDEIRALENLPPIQGGAGQVYYMPVNSVPILKNKLATPADELPTDTETQPGAAAP